MRPGTILRGCTIIESEQPKELESITPHRIDTILEEAKDSLDKFLQENKLMFHEKLDELDKQKQELEKEYNAKVLENEEKFNDFITEVEKSKEELFKDINDSINKYMKQAENEIKDIALILFEKFFYKQYDNMDNLESLIYHSLEELEDSKEIQISLSQKYYDSFKKEKKDYFDTLLEKDIILTSHPKDSLICEIKSELGNIEIDFNKQLEQITETIKNY